MVYKGHDIEIVYLPGSDFKVKDGVVISRNPTHIDYVRVTDASGFRWNELSVKDAKREIDRMIASYGKVA